MKRYLLLSLLVCFILTVQVYSIESEEFDKIAYRISGRAQIIKERVESIHEDQSSKYPNLYYFIHNTLSDINMLYRFDDIENARNKLLLLDAITYDVVCAGVSASFELNKGVGVLQKSNKAGSLVDLKNEIQKSLGVVSKRGLSESIMFTKSEEKYFSAIARSIKKDFREIKPISSKNDVKNFVAKIGLISSENLFFKIPSNIEPPLTGYIFSFGTDNQWGLVPRILFDSEPVAKETLVLALFNLILYENGFGINNNETLESQLHYLLLQMRIIDWIPKLLTDIDIDELKKIQSWFRDSFEKLTDGNYMPQYYDRLFDLKLPPSLDRAVYNWDKDDKHKLSQNAPKADDYLFCLMGNGSQMPPNPRMVDFLDKYSSELPIGTAFDLGSGDGRNTLYLAKKIGLFKRVIAVDHSSVAIERIKQLNDLEYDIVDINPVQEDILKYRYPDKRTPLFQRASFILLDNVVEFIPENKRSSLFFMLHKALLPGGVIFIEYHLASGIAFENMKKSEKFTIDQNNILTSSSDYGGTQVKKFFVKDELMKEFSYIKGYSMENIYLENEKDFNIGILILKKNK